jgi:predicted  nucleic acid-binding Zn-ribbon protein
VQVSDELDRRAAEIARLRDELDAARAECERLRAELEELQHSHHELVTDMAREIDQLRVRPSTPWPHTGPREM